MIAVVERQFLDDLRHWVENDRKVALRLFDMMEAVLREPFQGIGKPEPLKHEFRGCWSRRLTAADRIVYRVAGNTVYFLQARYHYTD
jgi:toxin YoeB